MEQLIKTGNPVRKALLDRKLSLGTWMQLGHPGIAEIFAGAGFDWIAADCEHTDIGVHEFMAAARGMGGRGPLPFARVRENDTLAIRQVLDAGAIGVIVPLVNSAEEARRAVRAAKFPPEGVRGFSFCRANGWGKDFAAYAASANDDTAVVAMVESVEAVESVDDILRVDGVDGVFIGPYDLSGSMGLTGQTSHPQVTEAFREVSRACARRGKSAGMHLVTPTAEAVKRAVADGFTFIALGMDTVFLAEGASGALALARAGRKPVNK